MGPPTLDDLAAKDTRVQAVLDYRERTKIKSTYLDALPADIRQDGRIHKTPKEALLDQDLLPPLPYQKLDAAYPLAGYLGNTILGSRTAAYHSSFGCPFTCSFCAVVPIYNARWRGKSAANIYRDIKFLKERFGANGVEFHDNNFFVSEKRTVEFARLIAPEQMGWWGEARIDTMDKYSDEALREIRQSGCRMIFFGAETGNDAAEQKAAQGYRLTQHILDYYKTAAS